jgi:murein DD-endopeptidase MepM/ murein hydrolase activator NlpD
VKLAVCVGIFAVAALLKLLFPSAFVLVGERINEVVNYKAALTALGEGFSGEKKFTAALSEAFTYAFTGSAPVGGEETAVPSGGGVSETEPSDNPALLTEEEPTATASQSEQEQMPTVTSAADEPRGETEVSPAGQEAEEESVAAFSESKPPDEEAVSFSDAVIAAFKESQEEYSDYAVPAGVSFDMPVIMFAHTAPVNGTVSSSFGFRVHPTKQTVLFHYGTDVAAPKGTEITAFADGKVIAAGESSTLGKYVLLSHGNVQTQYAHCSDICVSTGQNVKLGERIASVGSTGNATESCLHFEMKVNGQYVNPAYYIGEWQ